MANNERLEMTQLGLYGLTPFVASAAALWLSPFLIPQHIAMDFHQLSLIYGAVIVSYLAGIGAGGILQPKKKQSRSFLPSMLITLTAFVVALPQATFFFSLGAVWRHVIILMLLIYLYLRDVNSVAMGLLPGWYGALRARLTLWATLSIALIIGRLAILGYY